jgi:hypothetical protein
LRESMCSSSLVWERKGLRKWVGSGKGNYPISFGGGRGSSQYIERRRTMLTHLCAWGNDAVNEVKPRRVNCWLKTMSKPPAVPARAPQNFRKAPRLGPLLKQDCIIGAGSDYGQTLR